MNSLRSEPGRLLGVHPQPHQPPPHPRRVLAVAREGAAEEAFTQADLWVTRYRPNEFPLSSEVPVPTRLVGAADGDGPDVFSDVRDLAVDPAGRIYVLQSTAKRIAMVFLGVFLGVVIARLLSDQLSA